TRAIFALSQHGAGNVGACPCAGVPPAWAPHLFALPLKCPGSWHCTHQASDVDRVFAAVMSVATRDGMFYAGPIVLERCGLCRPYEAKAGIHRYGQCWPRIPPPPAE